MNETEISENQELSTENITENSTEFENTTIDDVNQTQEETVVSSTDYSRQLDTIHEDLGIICCFLILFAIVILLKYIYKFFNMFFVM